jgi:pSer/pThr/pTyr-binding forkhead associated (FHA) protein
MGRFTDRFDNPDRIAFKSKVVSRGHAEVWIENNRVSMDLYILSLTIVVLTFSFLHQVLY